MGSDAKIASVIEGKGLINLGWDQSSWDAAIIEKLITEFRAGRVSRAIVLVHAYTDPCWFHELASFAAAICFTVAAFIS